MKYNPMTWTSKQEPIYVRHGDKWYNERDNHIYYANIERRTWDQVSDGTSCMDIDLSIPFPKKTKIMK